MKLTLGNKITLGLKMFIDVVSLKICQACEGSVESMQLSGLVVEGLPCDW